MSFEHERIGACAIYCSDGRYNEQFDEFLHQHLKLPRYDRLVVPGGPAALAGHLVAHRDEASLVDQLAFLIQAHELERVVLIAHGGCGFYMKRLYLPESRVREQQEQDLRAAMTRVETLSVRVRTDAYIAEVVEGRVVMNPVAVSGS